MYRIQLAGNDYADDEAGMHYQIHRGIGIHHTAAAGRGEPLPVSVFVGGPPAHTLAAVMPLPEGLSELLFAGMLAGRRFGWTRRPDGFVVSADADFTITGFVDPGRTLPEGPFGDHLGYYSLAHPFPVLRVTSVTHREGAVWPLTVVGRPPQEDTTFGQLIHEITGPMVPTSLPGVHSLHAVDAAGVHPLLLAVGSERYAPWGERRPQELWTIANAILGFGQCSLAKYLFLAAREKTTRTSPPPTSPRMFDHILRRVDLASDLHFQTRTTMDTLDYSGTGLNAGSKLIVAGAGPPPAGTRRLRPPPRSFSRPGSPGCARCSRVSSSSAAPGSRRRKRSGPSSPRSSPPSAPPSAPAPSSPASPSSSSATSPASPPRACGTSSGSPSLARTPRTMCTAVAPGSGTSTGAASSRCSSTPAESPTTPRRSSRTRRSPAGWTRSPPPAGPSTASSDSRRTKRPAWESGLEEMGNPVVRADAGRFPHRVAARIACAIRSAVFRGEGGPSPHPSPAALRAASAREGPSPAAW